MKSNFKELLKELDGLMRDARGSLFRRAQIVVALIKDDDYWEYLKTRDLHQICSQLQRYVSDAKFSIDDLQVMLEFAPDSRLWESANLAQLCAESWEAKAAKNPTRATTFKPQTPEVERLRTKVEELAAENRSNRHTESMVEKMRARIDELTAENSQLKKENRELKKRLEAVEKCFA